MEDYDLWKTFIGLKLKIILEILSFNVIAPKF